MQNETNPVSVPSFYFMRNVSSSLTLFVLLQKEI